MSIQLEYCNWLKVKCSLTVWDRQQLEPQLMYLTVRYVLISVKSHISLPKLCYMACRAEAWAFHRIALTASMLWLRSAWIQRGMQWKGRPAEPAPRLSEARLQESCSIVKICQELAAITGKSAHIKNCTLIRDSVSLKVGRYRGELAMEETSLIFAPFDPCSLDRIDTVIKMWSRDEVAAQPEGRARSFLKRKHLNRFGRPSSAADMCAEPDRRGRRALRTWTRSGRGLVEGFCQTTFLFIKQKAVTNNITV